MILKNRCVLVLCTKVASALEGFEFVPNHQSAFRFNELITAHENDNFSPTGDFGEEAQSMMPGGHFGI